MDKTVVVPMIWQSNCPSVSGYLDIDANEASG